MKRKEESEKEKDTKEEALGEGKFVGFFFDDSLEYSLDAKGVRVRCSAKLKMVSMVNTYICISHSLGGCFCF